MCLTETVLEPVRRWELGHFPCHFFLSHPALCSGHAGPHSYFSFLPWSFTNSLGLRDLGTDMILSQNTVLRNSSEEGGRQRKFCASLWQVRTIPDLAFHLAPGGPDASPMPQLHPCLTAAALAVAQTRASLTGSVAGLTLSQLLVFVEARATILHTAATFGKSAEKH